MLEQEGILVDKDKGQYKVYTKFLGFKVGEWKKLPAVQFIGISRVKFSQTMDSATFMGNENCTTKSSDYKYCVFLCKSVKQKIMVYKGDQDKALEIANSIANYLSLSVTDFTKPA